MRRPPSGRALLHRRRIPPLFEGAPIDRLALQIHGRNRAGVGDVVERIGVEDSLDEAIEASAGKILGILKAVGRVGNHPDAARMGLVDQCAIGLRRGLALRAAAIGDPHLDERNALGANQPRNLSRVGVVGDRVNDGGAQRASSVRSCRLGPAPDSSQAAGPARESAPPLESSAIYASRRVSTPFVEI